MYRTFSAAFVFLTLFASVGSSAIANPIEVGVDSSDPRVTAEVLQIEPRMGRDLEVFVRIHNASHETLTTFEVEIEQRDRRGRVRAYHSFTDETVLAPGEEYFVTRRTDALEPRRGDVFLVRVAPTANPFDPASSDDLPDVNRVIEKQFPFKGCSGFCDRCADRAASLCASGLSEYSCSCTEESSSCSFKCAV